MTDELDDDLFSTARVTAREEAVTLGEEDYRSFLYDLDDEELAPWRGMGYQEFSDARHASPFLRELEAYWLSLYAEPFVGVTTDGTVRPVWPLPAPIEHDSALVAAATAALAVLPAAVRYPLDAPEWRAWINPEFVIERVGVRLEELDEHAVAAALALVEATLSTEGYARVREAMALNGFLGELTGLPTVMNERSYWFAIYGDPAVGGAWGWQLFGHHVAVNAVTVAGRHVIAPVFLGGEPALSEDRPPLFDGRERLALALAASLDARQRELAIVYSSVLDPAMPEGRLHPADERHVAGAFRDNRVVPTEGIRASELGAEQQRMLRDVVEDFLLLLRPAQRAATLAIYDAHLDETFFSWYGATDGSQPVYFRIQSPVILAELDNHAGVWLTNREPARFHVHTTLRLPNGNDYGKAWIAQL